MSDLNLQTSRRQLLPFALCLLVVLILVLLDTQFKALHLGFWSGLEHALGKAWQSHPDRDLLLFFFFDSLAIYLFVLVLALFSYRYLYNFKILLAGFLFLMTGIFNLIYFLTLNDLKVPERVSYHTLLYLLYGVDILVVGLAPSYLPRAATQVFLGIFFLLKSSLIVFASWYLVNYRRIGLPSLLQSPATILALDAVAALIPLRISLKRGDYYGGAVAGLALIFAVSYVVRKQPPHALEVLLIISVPVILAIFVFANWMISLSHRVNYDPLVRIYNRGYCDAIIQGRSLSLGRQYCVVLFDIDHFKEFNDRYGHVVGDKVLYHVGQKIRDMTLPRGITCRYGGEEVIVFFPNTTIDYAKKAAQDTVAAVSRLKIPSSKKKGSAPLRVTVSGGLASSKNGKGGIEQAIIAADKALYRSKEAGRNRLSVVRKSQ